MIKICTKCGAAKPLSDYTFPHTHIASHCRACRVAQKREARRKAGAVSIEQVRMRATARREALSRHRIERAEQRCTRPTPLKDQYRKEYFAWNDMKKRCLNLRHRKYPRYGGRGISICPAWLHSFRQFLDDLGPCPDKALSLDRIDNDGNYEAGNVRWATSAQQHSSQTYNNGRRRRVA